MVLFAKLYKVSYSIEPQQKYFPLVTSVLSLKTLAVKRLSNFLVQDLPLSSVVIRVYFSIRFCFHCTWRMFWWSVSLAVWSPHSVINSFSGVFKEVDKPLSKKEVVRPLSAKIINGNIEK